jgi:hypothetical protein
MKAGPDAPPKARHPFDRDFEDVEAAGHHVHLDGRII